MNPHAPRESSSCLDGMGRVKCGLIKKRFDDFPGLKKVKSSADQRVLKNSLHFPQSHNERMSGSGNFKGQARK